MPCSRWRFVPKWAKPFALRLRSFPSEGSELHFLPNSPREGETLAGPEA